MFLSVLRHKILMRIFKLFSAKVKAKDGNKIDILIENADYGDVERDVKFVFSFDERRNLLHVIQKYSLDELVEGKSDVEIALELMHWFCGLYKHGNPPGGLAGVKTPQAIMEFAGKNNNQTNCRGLSIALAQLIRAYNIRAFHVTCSPYENPFDDCHVVVCVYCGSLGKHIMLDPSANLYLKNKDDEIIGIDECRDILIEGGTLIPNEGHTDWGKEGSQLNLNEYREYMAKNLIRIERYSLNGYGIDGQGRIILIPEKYMHNEARNFGKATQEAFVTSRGCFWKTL